MHKVFIIDDRRATNFVKLFRLVAVERGRIVDDVTCKTMSWNYLQGGWLDCFGHAVPVPLSFAYWPTFCSRGRMGSLSNQLSQKIYFIRGQQVMLDSDLAQLYQVETKAFNRAVKRNQSRFPEDFMFQLTNQEVAILKYQIGASSFEGWGGRRKLPYVFTEKGVATTLLIGSGMQARAWLPP